MAVEYSIRERVALLVSNAKQLVLQLEEQGIELSANVVYGGARVYVARGYKSGDMRVDVSWEEPKCSVADVASDQPGQMSETFDIAEAKG